MKRTLLFTLSLIFIIFTSSLAQTVSKGCVDGRVYVKFRKEALKAIAKENPRNINPSKFPQLKDLFSKYGVTKVYKPFYQADDDEVLPYILKMEFTQIAGVERFITDLRQFSEIEYAEKVSLNTTDVVPNDALFATTNGSTHLNQINAQSAWNVFSGNSNITVAIVDNAIMTGHADLAANIYTNAVEAAGTAGVDDDHNGYVDDINGFDVAEWDNGASPTNISQDHGTHCAGIAGACTNNNIGVASIGWGIKIIPVKSSYDASLSAYVDLGYEGIIYAVKAKARIISCSWNNASGVPSISEQAVIDYAWNRGCIVFVAAGNSGSSSPNYPAAYSHAFSVANVDPSDVKYSNSSYGSWVDISAPGVNILSTLPYTSTPSYNAYTGTSMATPMVAGLAALMLSKSPGMTQTDVLNCISSTAANIYTLSGNSSYSGSLGAGRIDAFAAMNCAATFSAVPPVANFYAFLPNTCPNTLIPFIDSSLYSPTSWSWTFQGGTPATSTSSNPSVQWSTTGTYSVSLTVSNANGSNTKTKLSYVTVAGPSSLPFAEGFQGTSFLPSGWVANNIWNDYIYWQRTTTCGGFGTSTACAMFDNYTYNAPGERDEMRTPKFDFTNVATARLRFDVAYARYDAYTYDSMEVKLSTDCGTSWTSIYFKGNSGLASAPDYSAGLFVPSSTQWRRDSIDISQYAAGHYNVMFSFLNHGHFGQAIYLDNINLVFPQPTLNIAGSSTICVNPAYTFTNASVNATNYVWSFQGGSPSTSTLTNPIVNYSTPGTYTVSLSGVNSTLTGSTTKTITVLPFPTVGATSATYCSNASYTLNGSGGSTYSWISSAGPVSSASSLVITPTANSLYTLVVGNGYCSSQGVYTINVVPGVSLTVSDQTICAGASTILMVGGASSYLWNTGFATNTISVAPVNTTSYTVTGFAGGCSQTKTVNVIVNSLPVSIVSTNSILCNGVCNGGINVNTSGGTGPYSYVVPGGCPGLPCNNLCAGNYALQTIDSKSCTANVPFVISSPAAIQASINTSGVSCPSCSDGSIVVSISGGVAPYIYLWSPGGSTSSSISNLAPGCYSLSTTDANLCTNVSIACISVMTSIQTQLLNSNLIIYPNPAHHYVQVELQGAFFDCRVYNNLGQLIVEKINNHNSYQLDLNGFAKGVYMIQVQSEDQKVWKKLLVE